MAQSWKKIEEELCGTMLSLQRTMRGSCFTLLLLLCVFHGINAVAGEKNFKINLEL